MKTKEISNLWKKYHEICLLYRNRSIPALIKYEDIFHANSFEEKKNLLEKNKEIGKKNEEIKQIIYIIQNEHKIEKIVEILLKEFNFSREEIENNISFYDAIFNLSREIAFTKTKFFIELLGSKENFLSAMRVGTPFENLETIKLCDNKSFLGIMSYKKEQSFEDKLISLSAILSISRDDAAKIFVSNWRYIYNSSQTTREIIIQWCSVLGITPERLGETLKNTPCFLTYSRKDLIHTKDGLEKAFSLSTEEAINVILSRPDIVSAPLYSADEILSKANGQFSFIVSKKPWLYKIYEGILGCHRGYNYGDYETILKFFEHVENTIGEIVDVQFKSFNPRVKDGVRNINKVPYTTLIVKKHGFDNQYCFVSFGSGYKTCNRYGNSPEERLLRSVFGERYKKRTFAEFIVDAPPLDSEEYETILWRVFAMSSTGNITPCDCALANETSIVVEEPESHFEKFEYNDISCIFRTLDVIPTVEIEKYRNKYKKQFPKKFDNDFEELNAFDDNYEDEEYVFEEEEDE